CRRGARRLVGRIAVELGLGIRHRETSDRLVPRGPRPRAPAPRQELALCTGGRPRGGRRRCPPSGPGPARPPFPPPPLPRAPAPRQELALCAGGRPRGGGGRCPVSGPGPVRLRFRHRPLAGAAANTSGIWGSLIPDVKRDASGDRTRGRLACAQPLRRASL